MLVINHKPQPIPQQKGKKIYLVDLIPDGDLRKKNLPNNTKKISL